MDQAFALFVISYCLQIKGFLDWFQSLDFVTFVFIIALVNTWDADHFLVALTVKIQEVWVLWTDGLSFVVLVKIRNSLSGSKDIINGEGIKLVEIQVVVNIFKSLDEQHRILWFVLDVLSRFGWGLMGLLPFEVLFWPSHRGWIAGLYGSPWSVKSVVGTHSVGALGKMHGV